MILKMLEIIQPCSIFIKKHEEYFAEEQLLPVKLLQAHEIHCRAHGVQCLPHGVQHLAQDLQLFSHKFDI